MPPVLQTDKDSTPQYGMRLPRGGIGRHEGKPRLGEPSFSPFGPAVKYSVSVSPLLPPLPNLILHSPSMTTACPLGSRTLLKNLPLSGSKALIWPLLKFPIS